MPSARRVTMKGTEDTIFPAYLPTAVANLSHMEGMIKAKANHFNKLCVRAGHALVFAWYQAMADALYANDLVKLTRSTFKVMQLYEAGMTAIIRLRLSTSHTQVLTDAHTWSEVARAISHAGSSDFYNFVKRWMHTTNQFNSSHRLRGYL